MVFFNCNACGEAIKKNQVEKHYRQQCRNCQVLSCVDCGKEFWGDEYAKHIKCITEDEKFGGKAYKPKPNANKGEQKQELWVQQVQDAILKLKANPKLKNLLERLKDYPNIPRKQAKFENFLYNSLRVMDRSLSTQAWNAIAAELSSSSPTELPAKEAAATANKKDEKKVTEEIDTEVAKETQNGHGEKKKKKHKKHDEESEVVSGNSKATAEKADAEAERGCRKKKKNKRKRDEEEVIEEASSKNKKLKTQNEEDEKEKKVETKVAEDANEEASDEAPTGKFKWEAAIIGVLKRADDKEITVKKLRKKVLGEFHARGGDGKHYSEEQLLAKFTKKINKNPRLKVHKDTVKLVS